MVAENVCRAAAVGMIICAARMIFGVKMSAHECLQSSSTGDDPMRSWNDLWIGYLCDRNSCWPRLSICRPRCDLAFWQALQRSCKGSLHAAAE